MCIRDSLGMHPLVGQRQDDALVDILREVHFVLPGHEPQHFAVVFVLLLGEADHEPPLEIDRNAAVLQTAVARDDDMARDPEDVYKRQLVLLVEKLRVHLGEGNLHPGEMFGKKSLRGCREFCLRQGAAVLAGRRQTGGQQLSLIHI